jgi:hypothetical protein
VDKGGQGKKSKKEEERRKKKEARRKKGDLGDPKARSDENPYVGSGF